MSFEFIENHYAEAAQKGLAEGIKKGLENGSKEQKEKISRRLKEKNISINKISNITQLPVDFIKTMPGAEGCFEKLLQRNYDHAFEEGLKEGKKMGFKKGFENEENRIKTELKKEGFSDEEILDITRYSMGDLLLYGDKDKKNDDEKLISIEDVKEDVKTLDLLLKKQNNKKK